MPQGLSKHAGQHFALFLSSVQLGWGWRAWASSRVLGRFPGSAGVGEEDPKEREMLRMAIGITRAENSHFLREYGIGLCLFPKGELWSFL